MLWSLNTILILRIIIRWTWRRTILILIDLMSDFLFLCNIFYRSLCLFLSDSQPFYFTVIAFHSWWVSPMSMQIHNRFIFIHWSYWWTLWTIPIILHLILHYCHIVFLFSWRYSWNLLFLYRNQLILSTVNILYLGFMNLNLLFQMFVMFISLN